MSAPRIAVMTVWCLLLSVLVAVPLSAQEAAPGQKTLRVELAPEEAQSLVEQAVNEQGGTRWALLVGIDNYLYPTSGGYVISPLTVPVRDVEALGALLTDPFRANFPPDQTIILTDEQATKRNILMTLNKIVRQAGPKDLVFFYYSGHGWRDPSTGTAYLLPYDADMEDPATTCIDLADLQEKFNQLKANKLVTVLDACHAGGIKMPGSKAVQEGPYDYLSRLFEQAEGRPMLLSSDESEVSWEMPNGENSVFTHFLLQGLSGAADYDSDGVIGFLEAARYVEEKVPEYTRNRFPTIQRPTRRDAGGQTRGDIPLTVDLEKLANIRDTLEAYGNQLAKLRSLAGSDGLSAAEVEEMTRFAMRVKERELRRRSLSPEERAVRELIERLADGEISVARYREQLADSYPEGLPSEEDMGALGNGTLRVMTAPLGAAIYIDGRFMAYAPKELRNLPAGRRRIRLVLPGKKPFERTVIIRDSEIAKLRYAW